VLHWEQDTLATLDAGIASALRGEPRAVVVHGGPGSGRSSLLATAVERARAAAGDEPVAVWTAGGVVDGGNPFQGLVELGIGIASGAAPTPPEADVLLREAIDAALDAAHGRGALVVAIDDLQWLDPESVDALARVLGTAEAERMLVVAAVGHVEPFQHPAWQQLVATSPLVLAHELPPLPLATARTIAREIRPEIRDELIERLWEHTRGNPLFLTSLLQRIALADLERMEQLPAPDGYARAIELRLAGLGEGAIELARAAAVIGSGWMPLAEAAHVAGLDHPAAALDVLDREFILEQRETTLGLHVRIVHAVIQASIYQHIPVADRVRLHARAADLAADEPGELRHRYAAATTYDEELAARLVEAADAQHEARSYRLAAMYLDWAARISGDGMLRSRRSMDSFYEWILAGSVDFVRDRLPDIRAARDRSGGALVHGALHVMDNEWIDAVRALAPFADSGADDLRGYRIEVLLAWASMCAGEPTEAVLAPLARAESMRRRDDALAGLATFATAMVAGRRDRPDEVREHMERLPSRPAAVPLDDTYWLAWQGMGSSFIGRITDAIEPLREVGARMATGFLDVADGLTHAFLGLCYELSGSPELAAQPYRTAEALLRPRPNPMTAITIAEGYTYRGERERAAELLAAARTTLRDMPWDEAVHTLLTGRVSYLHAFGSDEERRALIAEHRRDFGVKGDRMHGIGPLARAHAALAYVWGDELETAEAHAAALEARTDLDWTSGMAASIRGLAAERRGDLDAAQALLARAVETYPDAVPLFAAHMAADLARVAAARGDREVAVAAERRAREGYARIRAIPYLTAGAPAPVDAAPPATPALPGTFGMLSDRERDVAALVVRGMSYAQIARELFITRSTVGFHLSRIYAKTGTSTRHELSELLRAEQLV
jgi:DNA-binding CsgD family transcriptional regulator